LYTAKEVANDLLARATKDGLSIDPLKMQKLIYLAHGWSLALRHRPLIKDVIEAWPYGPVVPSLYRELKSLRANSIPPDRFAGEKELDLDSRNLVSAVWNRYKNKSAIDLSMLTHERGYAWDQARDGWEFSWNSPEIPDALIAAEFQSRATAAKAIATRC
jgi:uncharacterized phage-associated protein